MIDQRNTNLDLHIHSTFSDGGDTPEEMIQSGIQSGLKYLGFSDHFSPGPSPWFYPGCYVSPDKLQNYVQTLEELKEKYKETIRILIGLEIYATGNIVTELPFERFEDVDFILFEDAHDYPDPVATLTEIRKKLPDSLIGLAHFDFSQVNIMGLIPVLEELDIFVELNNSYYQYYRNSEAVFRQIAVTKLPVSIGSDAHDYREVGKTGNAREFAGRIGLYDNIGELITHLGRLEID